MADEATVGLMLWDRESVGTVMNVLRLIRTPQEGRGLRRAEARIRRRQDRERLGALPRPTARTTLKERVAKESLVEQGDERGSAQASLL